MSGKHNSRRRHVAVGQGQCKCGFVSDGETVKKHVQSFAKSLKTRIALQKGHKKSAKGPLRALRPAEWERNFNATFADLGEAWRETAVKAAYGSASTSERENITRIERDIKRNRKREARRKIRKKALKQSLRAAGAMCIGCKRPMTRPALVYDKLWLCHCPLRTLRTKLHSQPELIERLFAIEDEITFDRFGNPSGQVQLDGSRRGPRPGPRPSPADSP